MPGLGFLRPDPEAQNHDTTHLRLELQVPRAPNPNTHPKALSISGCSPAFCQELLRGDAYGMNFFGRKASNFPWSAVFGLCQTLLNPKPQRP